MNEYISRDDVLRKFIEGDGDDEFTEGYNFAVNEYREKIKAMQAADVQPVRHGQWITDDDITPDNWRCCSNCYHLEKRDYKRFKFCPNCGAKMDGNTD